MIVAPLNGYLPISNQNRCRQILKYNNSILMQISKITFDLNIFIIWDTFQRMSSSSGSINHGFDAMKISMSSQRNTIALEF